MFGSLTMLASGRLASSPSCVSQSGTRCVGVRFSGKLARMRPDSEMSASSMVRPLPAVNFWMIGKNEYVASAGASSISVQMIFPGDPVTDSSPSSESRFLVPMGMALDRDGNGQRGDVAGMGQDVDAERGRVAAVALRADAQAVGARQQLLLERLDGRVGVRRANLAEERLLREQRRLLEGAADPDAQDQRGAGVGARALHALD